MYIIYYNILYASLYIGRLHPNIILKNHRRKLITSFDGSTTSDPNQEEILNDFERESKIT